MKVYVVLESTRDTDFEFCGVYQTMEEADNRIEEIIEEFRKDKNGFYPDERGNNLYVETWDFDKRK